jgi:hypothetical protein
MIDNPELFEQYIRDHYPTLHKKVEGKLIYSPSPSHMGMFDVNNPLDNEEDAGQFEKIILEYSHK